MNLVIDKNKWLRGEGGINSYLLRSKDGKMCCLGQLAEQCNIPLDDLKDKTYLYNIKESEIDKIPFDSFGLILYHIAEINDNRSLSDSEREESLTCKFKELNVDVTFV